MRIELDHLYARPDGRFAITVVRDGERNSCCNAGHKTAVEAIQHGQDQIWSVTKKMDEDVQSAPLE